LLFARTCFVVATFLARILLVRDGLEDIRLTETEAEGVEGEAVVRIDTDIEGTALIY